VFVSFLAGLAAMARFSLRDRRRGLAAVNLAAAAAVAFTLLVNLARGYPQLSMAATAVIAAACTPCGPGPGGPRASSKPSATSMTRRRLPASAAPYGNRSPVS